jgi:hypothetical protein
MPVDAAEIAELRRMKAAMPEQNLSEMSVLQSMGQMIGYMSPARDRGLGRKRYGRRAASTLRSPSDEVRGLVANGQCIEDQFIAARWVVQPRAGGRPSSGDPWRLRDRFCRCSR